MALSTAQQQIIASADPAAIYREFKSVSSNWSHGRWLQLRNRYLADASKRLADDEAIGRAPHDSQLRQFIAVSSVLHCVDGWSYLGRATDARLRGDYACSCHLAYYAELRASMALLAAQGIGVLNNRHCIVNAARHCIPVPARGGRRQGTHLFAWESLEYRATTSNASDLVFDTIQAAGIPLGQWLDHFSVGSGFRSILATQWLAQWGMDLQRYAFDRDARNLMSYRPTTFSNNVQSVREALSSVANLWRVHEPFESNRFLVLDRQLLRNSLEFYFRHTHATNRTPRQASAIYRRLISAMLHQLSPTDNTVDWEHYLMSDEDSKSPLLESAKGTAAPHDPSHPNEIAARAALLLRLATGACFKLLASIPLEKDSLRFWSSPFGLNRCLWQKGAEPANSIDLWTDIRESIDESDAWCANSAVSTESYRKLRSDIGADADTFGSFERVALWGLGL